MNFQVPQFIEVEDKIFGPLTFKQFVYLAGSAGTIYLLFHFLPIYVAALPIVAVGAFGAALAFYKVNSRPFIQVTESAFRYTFTHKLYLWKRAPKDLSGAIRPPGQAEVKPVTIPKLSHSRLKDLSWSLDVNETIK